MYDTIPGIILGDETDASPPYPEKDIRLCFNCGSPDHAVASCPEHIDRQRVSLSRQLFYFLHPDLVGQEYTRVYLVEAWKQQRVEWLNSFEPGMIRGYLLRDALGLRDGDPGDHVEWLRSMANWGYPPGWVASKDPRQSVHSRILQDEVDATEWDPFTIFDGTEIDEEIDLSLCSPPCCPTTSTASTAQEPIRWATYPNTYFSSSALSIYGGVTLDSFSSASVTFTAERRALWERILSGGVGTNDIQLVPPWRMPGAFNTLGSVEVFVPPPPSTTPPPLPLSPTPPKGGRLDITDDETDGSIADMDMSDAE